MGLAERLRLWLGFKEPSLAPAMPIPTASGAGFTALAAVVGSALAATLIVDTRQDEGVVYKAYPDLGGTWSVCSGSTSNVNPGEVDSAEQCDARTANDLLRAANIVLRCAPDLKGHHNQLRAVIRFQNNTGKFCQSTGGKLMKTGQYKAGCDALLRYNGIISTRPIKGAVTVRRLKDGRYFNVIRGLVNRRAHEHQICVEGL
jgi:lysozyme